MEASHARANLLSIPPEIRNRICMLVLVLGGPLTPSDGEKGPEGIRMIEVADSEIMEWRGSDYTEYHNYGTEAWLKQPPLTRVCKQLREETLPIYYGANTFLMHVWENESEKIKGRTQKLYSQGTRPWLKSIGEENRGMINSVVLESDDKETPVSAARFTSACRAAGVGLDNAMVTSYYQEEVEYNDRGLRGIRKEWRSIAAEDDDIGSESGIEWEWSF